MFDLIVDHFADNWLMYLVGGTCVSIGFGIGYLVYNKEIKTFDKKSWQSIVDAAKEAFPAEGVQPKSTKLKDIHKALRNTKVVTLEGAGSKCLDILEELVNLDGYILETSSDQLKTRRADKVKLLGELCSDQITELSKSWWDSTFSKKA